MSVLRHGGTYLQRRLTKMYTDTKTCCESVTTASKAADDPELFALHRNFRTQRDRLLAWGLDWSDASAAQPNDIDESLTQAGFSDVVESVMSSIQELLSEAERLQQTGVSDLRRKTSSQDSTSKGGLTALPAKIHWTNEDIDRSKALLTDLTGCIDTLYDLSRSRRDMSSSGQSMPSWRRTRRRFTKTPDGFVYPDIIDSKAYPDTYADIKAQFVDRRNQGDSEYASLPNTVHSRASDHNYYTPTTPAAPTLNFAISRSALQLYGTAHDNSPPPYEVVAASANSRVVGRVRASELPFNSDLEDTAVLILVEYTPMMLGSQNSVTIPANQRLNEIYQGLDQLVQNARVSHLGLLKFLGYYVDEPNSRYAFIYQMPVDYFSFLRNPNDLLNDLKPKPLVAMLNADSSATMPSLETRFRLAYDLLMAMLHLRSQNIVHGNINSSNILIFPSFTDFTKDEIGITENMRHPYLTSLAQFSGDCPPPEPLSSSMYRHPEDKRMIDGDAAWAYDLYSLGLVLMEIGLWTPVSRLWKMKYDNMIFKQRIESLYLQKLGPKCGTAYLNVVQLCLDAPNFHLSTQPLEDLKLRIPQTFYYPVLDLSAPNSTFSFSMNFIYTMCKIVWSCCRIDLYSAPATEELDDWLPLALVPETGGESIKETMRTYQQSFEQPGLPVNHQLATPSFEDWKSPVEIRSVDEKKIKKRSLKKLTHVEIPQGQLNEWNTRIMPRLRKLLEKILREAPESCSATLVMTGDTIETAKPTICVTCPSAKRVRAALKKYFFVDKEHWDLVVVRGEIQRSRVPRKKRRGPARPVIGLHDAPERDLNPCYQEHPLCGASIGAFRNEKHLPPVSYGGAILVDGKEYGMTVHHILEMPSDDEEDTEVASAASDQSDRDWPTIPYLSRPELMQYGEDSSEADLEFVISDDENEDDYSLSQELEGSFDEHWLSDDSLSDEGELDPDGERDDEDTASVGDTVGIEPGEDPQQFVTQPAIDDVHEGFFPSPEDRDDEHLASHTLGYIHASSGVRRWTREGIKHEIDWALIRINDSRIDARNIVFDKSAGRCVRTRSERESMIPGKPIYLNGVARMEDLGGLQVNCCGRTSGLQSGQISRAMTIVKLRGRQSFSTSFSVDGNFGAPGDSGAWVFDKSTGHVCGHVVAWSEKSRTTYIAPMDVLLEDIARTLNATQVSLPNTGDELTGHPAGSQSSSPSGMRHARFYPANLRVTDQLPVDFSRLSVGVSVNDRQVGSGPAGSARSSSSDLREVSSPYQSIPLLAQPRSLERQLA